MHLSKLTICPFEFAAEAHAGQYRKTGDKIPYISHPMRVAKNLARHGAADDVISAAVLHDVIEDCGVSASELADKFGERIAKLVAGCTEDKSIIDWVERKSLKIMKLENASFDVVLIVCADKTDNLRCLVREMNVSYQESDVWKDLEAKEKDQRWRDEKLWDVFHKRLCCFESRDKYKLAEAVREDFADAYHTLWNNRKTV